jgi:hypothetical protein
MGNIFDNANMIMFLVGWVLLIQSKLFLNRLREKTLCENIINIISTTFLILAEIIAILYIIHVNFLM